MTPRDGTAQRLAGPTARHGLFAQTMPEPGPAKLCRVFDASNRFRSTPAVHNRTGQRSTADRVYAGQGPIWLVWRVKDSNLGRHQPTDLQNSARDVPTSNHSPSAPVQGPNRARSLQPRPSTSADLLPHCLPTGDLRLRAGVDLPVRTRRAAFADGLLKMITCSLGLEGCARCAVRVLGRRPVGSRCRVVDCC